MLQRLRVQDRAAGLLAEPVPSGGDELPLKSGHSFMLDQYPYIVAVGDEKLEVVDRIGDILLLGERGVDGSVIPDEHLVNTPVLLTVKEQEIRDLHDRIDLLSRKVVGDMDGILADPMATYLTVVPTDPVSMTFQVLPGMGQIDLETFYFRTAYTHPEALVAPVGDDRIDLVQIGLVKGRAVVTVKQGAESGDPVAPTPDAGRLVLATIELTPSDLFIDTGQIDNNDGRVWI